MQESQDRRGSLVLDHRLNSGRFPTSPVAVHGWHRLFRCLGRRTGRDGKTGIRWGPQVNRYGQFSSRSEKGYECGLDDTEGCASCSWGVFLYWLWGYAGMHYRVIGNAT